MEGEYEALQCTELSKTFEDAIGKLTIRKTKRRPLKQGEVRIQVFASAVNYFDLLMLCGRYQHKPPLPFTVGTEGSGRILEVGKGTPKHLKEGMEVIFGMATGGMADEMIAPFHCCIPKPKEWTHSEAAGLFVGYTTAFNGLIQRGKLQKEEILLVTGAAGGMGMAAIQLGKAIGAKVIAVASSQEKVEAALAVGADFGINLASTPSIKDQVNKFTNGKGVDVVYDVVGGDLFDQCVRIMGDEGRLLVIGFASGRIPSVAANLPLVKGFSVVGVRAGESMRRHPNLAMEMLSSLKGFTDKGQLKPHVEKVFQKEEYKRAFESLSSRKIIGKSVIEWKTPSKL